MDNSTDNNTKEISILNSTLLYFYISISKIISLLFFFFRSCFFNFLLISASKCIYHKSSWRFSRTSSIHFSLDLPLLLLPFASQFRDFLSLFCYMADHLSFFSTIFCSKFFGNFRFLY